LSFTATPAAPIGQNAERKAHDEVSDHGAGEAERDGGQKDEDRLGIGFERNGDEEVGDADGNQKQGHDLGHEFCLALGPANAAAPNLGMRLAAP
jgi:hypothetical protein